jgi:hypothetical protein
MHGQIDGGFGRARLARLSNFKHGGCGAQLLDLASQARLRTGLFLVAAYRVGDLGQVTGAGGRHHRRLVGAVAYADQRQGALGQLQAELCQADLQRLVQRGHAVVVEARGHGAEHRHLLRWRGPGFLVALHLLGHIAQSVRGALAVELVDGDELGEIEHVDLFQLAGGAKLRRHHVHRHVHMRHDGGIALADARGLHDDQIEAGRLAGRHHVGQRLADLTSEVTRGQAAHEDARPLLPRVDRVHADAVAQQGATALAPRRVDRNHRHARRVVLVQPQAADQFVGKR